MNEALTRTLPHGLPSRGRGWARHVQLRPLRGLDEVWLSSLERDTTIAEVVTGLIGRCVGRIAGVSETGPELARAFTVADRAWLLISLREFSLGKEVRLTLRCPDPDCDQQIDCTLTTDQLLPEPASAPATAYEDVVEGPQGKHASIRFRLLNGKDQEELSRDGMTADSPLVGLLVRCLLQVSTCPLLDRATIASLPSQMLTDIEAAISKVDPFDAVEFEVVCPHCASAFSQRLSPVPLFVNELALLSRRIFHEVHVLASQYHWSEREILRMSASRRRIYMDLLDQRSGVQG